MTLTAQHIHTLDMPTVRLLILIITLALPVAEASAFTLKGLAVENIAVPHLEEPGIYTQFRSTPHTGFGPGLAAFGEFELTQTLGLETGFSYYSRNYSFTEPGFGSDFTLEYRDKFLQLPLLVRAHLPFRFSAALGGYVGRYLGDVDIEVKSSYGQYSYSESRSDLGYKAYDAGLLASIAYSYPFDSRAAVVLDVRYAHGFVDKTTSDATSLKFSDVSFLAGLEVAI